MPVNGTWALTMQSPLGERAATVVLSATGTSLTGTQSAEGISGNIFDGREDGGRLSWKFAITEPVPITLEFEGVVTADTMTGTMTAGMYGAWPFTASRIGA